MMAPASVPALFDMLTVPEDVKPFGRLDTEGRFPLAATFDAAPPPEVAMAGELVEPPHSEVLPSLVKFPIREALVPSLTT
jgi:hypothetical protein